MIHCRFTIDALHPSLPGHFPGRPVVPGVVVLDRLAATIERECNAHLVKLPQVKFLRPLLPGEDAELIVEHDLQAPRFIVRCGDALIAKGTFETAS